MGVQYVHAKEGKRFTLTELGFEKSYIRAKYERTAALARNYQKAVPKSWVTNGWVKEVDDKCL